MSLLSYFFSQTIAVIYSPINGNIYIKEAFGRRYIEVGGLMQSGRILEKLFRAAIKQINAFKKTEVKKILLLGVGGGTIIKLLKKSFPEAMLVGVDIDVRMVEVGEKYLGLTLDKTIDVRIGDVFDPNLDLGKDYDLIIVDLFRGYTVPSQINSPIFLKRLQSLLGPLGIVVFNRLYFQKYKLEANLFLDNVREIFHHVTSHKHYFNILIFAKK